MNSGFVQCGEARFEAYDVTAMAITPAFGDLGGFELFETSWIQQFKL